MVFPTANALSPCLTQNWSPSTRRIWRERYCYVKKYGIRTTFGVVSGTGCYTLIKEAAIGEVKRHAKRYIGCILVGTGLTCVSGGIPLLTNATKVVQISKACHSTCAGLWRASHNIAELPFLLCDFLLFGEPVPSCGESDYDLFGHDTSDFINKFTE
jgi:hypothetical protein